MHTGTTSMHTGRIGPSMHTGTLKIPIYELVIPICILVALCVFQNANYTSIHTGITSMHTGNTNIQTKYTRNKTLIYNKVWYVPAYKLVLLVPVYSVSKLIYLFYSVANLFFTMYL